MKINSTTQMSFSASMAHAEKGSQKTDYMFELTDIEAKKYGSHTFRATLEGDTVQIIKDGNATAPTKYEIKLMKKAGVALKLPPEECQQIRQNIAPPKNKIVEFFKGVLVRDGLYIAIDKKTRDITAENTINESEIVKAFARRLQKAEVLLKQLKKAL